MASGCRRYDEDFVEGLRHVTATLRSNSRGEARVKLDLEDGETAVLATAITDPNLGVHWRSLTGPRPDKTPLFDAFDEAESARSKTNAGYISSVSTLNWPVLNDDLAVSDGRWWLEAGVVADEDYVKDDLVVEVLIKEDADLTGGVLRANLVFAGGTGGAELAAAVDEAVLHWQDLYAGQLGIDVQTTTMTWEEGDLEAPGFGSAEDYEAISAATPLRSVNIVIAPDIRGLDDVYGIAGDIPGPLTPSARSAVLVSALIAAGPDNEFSEEEVRLLGETFAHETGHFLGLFHPVENDWDRWDALDDTPECGSENKCVAQLDTNLMFPFPVCGFTLRSCTPQTAFTDQQSATANRHVAVD